MIWDKEARVVDGTKRSSGIPGVRHITRGHMRLLDVSIAMQCLEQNISLFAWQFPWDKVAPRRRGSIWVASAAASSAPTTIPPNRVLALLRCSAGSCQTLAFPLKNIITMELVSLHASADGYAIGCAIKLNIPAQEQTCVGGLLGYHAGAWSIVKGQEALNP